MSKQTFIVGIETDKTDFNDWIAEHDAEIRADAIIECLQIVQKIKDDYNDARFGEQIPINYGTICGIIIEIERLKEQK